MSEINLFFQLYNCWLLMLVTYEYNELQRTCTIHFKTEKVMAYIVLKTVMQNIDMNVYAHILMQKICYGKNCLFLFLVSQ